MVHQNRSNFRFWLPVQIWNDLWPIILCNLKTKHRRYIKLYIFWILMTRQTIWHYLQRNRSMFQFSTHMELSRSMAAILEMPQYVAYQKNVVCAFIKLSAKSHSFNILCTMDGLSCPTIDENHHFLTYSAKHSAKIPCFYDFLAKNWFLLIFTYIFQYIQISVSGLTLWRHSDVIWNSMVFIWVAMDRGGPYLYTGSK